MGLFGGLEASLKLNASDFSSALRSAQSTTSGFGRSVSSTFDNVGDEASAMSRAVKRSASGFGRLKEALTDTLVPARLLSGQLDEVGDEAGSAGRKARAASRGFMLLSITSSGLSFSLGILSTVTTSTAVALTGLLTVLGLLAVALAPIAIGAAAIAAAFGVIIGTGILAWGKGFKKTLKKVKKQIIPLVKAFGQKFVPLIKDAVKALPGLVKSILNAIGPLKDFKQALRKLGAFAARVLPKLIGWFFDLGRYALPIIIKLGKFFMQYVVPALRKLIKIGKSVNRWIAGLVKNLIKATKKGTVLRRKFNKLKNALVTFWQKSKPLRKALADLFRQLSKIVPVVVGLAFDIGRLAVIIGTKLLPYAVRLIQFLTGLVKWFNKLSPGVKRAILVVGGLIAVAGPLIGAITTIISVLSTVVTVVGTVIAIFNPLTLAVLAVGAVIAGLAYVVYKNWNQIVTFTRNLVNSVSKFFGQLGTDIRQFARNAIQAVNDFVNGVIKWFVNLHTNSKRVFSNITDLIMDYITGRRGPLASLFSAGQALINEFVSGIKSKVSDVINTVQSMAQRVRNLLPFSPAKTGPLSSLDKAGPGLVKTFAKGIRSSESIAVRAAKSMVQKVQSAIQNTMSETGMWAGQRSKLASGILQGIPVDLAKQLVDKFRTTMIKTANSNQFKPLSSFASFRDFIREARQYGKIEGREHTFFEDTASVAIEGLFKNPYNVRDTGDINVVIETDDEALSKWVTDKAEVTINKSVSSALQQARRRRTFDNAR